MHNSLGNYYWQHGNLNAAATQWEQAVRLQPNATYTLDNLGLLHIREYEATLKIDPQNQIARSALTKLSKYFSGAKRY